MSKIKVFIADDHKLIREGLKSIFEFEKDIEVVGEAQDGQEAIVRIKELKPDVVLLDLKMPRVDGVSVCREVLKDNPDMKIIILTTFDFDEDIFNVLEAGATSYLLKDIESKDLIQAVQMVMHGQSLLHPSIAKKVFCRKIDQTSLVSPILSERELEVLKLMAKGFKNKEIAREMWLSQATIKTHVSNILHKLGTPDRTRAVLQAIRLSLVKEEQ